MSIQYTFVDVIGSNIFVKLRDTNGVSEFIVSENLFDINSRKCQQIDLYQPDLNGNFKSLDNKNLKQSLFNTINEAKKWKSQSGNVYGQTSYMYTWIANNFENVQPDDSVFITGIIDIETMFDRTKSFDKHDYSGKLLSCTLFDNKTKQFFVLGYHDNYINSDVTYINCETESDMLIKIAQWIHASDIDFLTGWNSEEFDIHYVYQRMLINKLDVKMLSPFYNKVDKRLKIVSEKDGIVNIVGITQLDYMKLFMKYTVENLPSYSLSFVSNKHLKDDKVDYKELGYTDLIDLYERNPDLFYEYNIHDVRLVYKLDNKLKFVPLAIVMAYHAGIRFSDVFSQIRFWDTYIYRELKKDNIVIPPNIHKSKGAFEGAYVKPVLTGKHKWVSSFDYTSLYPSIMRTFNISYETFIKMAPIDDVKLYRTGEKQLPPDVCIAANGAMYRTDIAGIMPKLVEKLFFERKHYQKLMKQTKAEIEKLGNEAPDSLKSLAVFYDIFQLVRKYAINSAYGILGSEFYRYYMLENAEAITATGQMLIKETIVTVNDYLNKVNKTTNVDYTIASDTDSIYVSLETLVDKYFNKDWLGHAENNTLYEMMGDINE